MFISSSNYIDSVRKVLEQTGQVDIAVAFWGRGAAELLSGSNKRYRILCNLRSGGTNPKEVEVLIRNGHDVLLLDDLHAKVVVGDAAAIAGSANFSTNGLNIESAEFDGWQEAGFWTDRPRDLREMRGWFESQWKRGHEVTARALDEAQANWDKRRMTRIPFSRAHKSVLTMTPAELEGRNIFVALWDDEASPEAVALAENWIERQEAKMPPLDDEDIWDYFEDWDAMKEGQEIISAFVGPRGGIEVRGVCRVFEAVVDRRVQGDRFGETITVHVCRKSDEVLGLPFTNADCVRLAKMIRESGKARRFIDAEEPLVPLSEFFKSPPG